MKKFSRRTFRKFNFRSKFAACGCKMSVVPQAAFAARKIRQNEEKKSKHFEGYDLSPTKYSSKYMNSIWGMYNRYSVHNLKKNMDKVIPSMSLQQSRDSGSGSPGTNQAADMKGSLAAAKNFLPSANFL